MTRNLERRSDMDVWNSKSMFPALLLYYRMYLHSSYLLHLHGCLALLFNVPLIGSARELFQRGRIIDERTLPRRRVT